MKEQERQSSVSPKGQITLPLEWRRRLGIRPKDKVAMSLEGDEVTIKPATSRIAKHFGALGSDIPALEPHHEKAAYEEGVAEEVSREGR